MAEANPAPKRVVWLVISDDEPLQGEWFARQRQASLKATWLRQRGATRVRLVRVLVDEDDAPPSLRRSLRP